MAEIPPDGGDTGVFFRFEDVPASGFDTADSGTGVLPIPRQSLYRVMQPATNRGASAGMGAIL